MLVCVYDVYWCVLVSMLVCVCVYVCAGVLFYSFFSYIQLGNVIG